MADVHRTVRELVPPLAADRVLSDDIVRLADAVADGRFDPGMEEQS